MPSLSLALDTQESQLTSKIPFGSRDFVAYWSAYQLARTNKNPYSVEDARQLQHSLGYSSPTQQYWNPPWTLTLLSPILSLPFIVSLRIWLIINIFLALLLGILSWKLTTDKPLQPAICFAATLLFLPVLLTLYTGQLSLLVATALLGSFLALEHKQEVFAGVLLFVACQKPHLFYLVLIPLLVWLILTRRFKVILSTALVFIVFLILTIQLFPNIFTLWNPTQASPTHWKSATAVTFLRYLFSSPTGEYPTWPMFVLPIISLLLFFSCFRKSFFNAPSWLWREHLPSLLCLSLVSAPYGWSFDWSVLVVIQVAVCASLGSSFLHQRSATAFLFCLLFSIQLISVLFVVFFHELHFLTWFPLAMLATWEFSLRIKQNQKRYDSQYHGWQEKSIS